NIAKLVQSAISPYGLKLVTKGGINLKEFPRVASMPGEKVKPFIDKHANARNAATSETPEGAVLLQGNIPEGGIGVLLQGSNILIGRETIYNQAIASGGGFPSPGGGGDASDATGGGATESPAMAPAVAFRTAVGAPREGGGDSGGGTGGDGGGGGGQEQAYTTTGQRPGTDDDWGANPTHQTFSQQGSSANFSPGFMPSQVASEIPAWDTGQMKSRGGIENNVSDQNQIFVFITVLGWQRPGLDPPGGQSGGIWEVGDLVDVESDWLIMHRPLFTKALTYQQDNQSGSRTTLDLVNAAAMNQGNFPAPS